MTGASGFVGMHLVHALNGHEISAIGRTKVPEIQNYYQKNIDANEDFTECFNGVDVVVHCAARAHIMRDEAIDPLAEYRKFNVEGTLNLAKQAAQLGVKRFIYLSSIKVNGESTTGCSPFTYSDNPAPEDAYGISKLEAEIGLKKLVAETGMDVVIIRPSLVYGPGVKGNFATMLNVVKKGIPLPFGSVNNKRSLVSVYNLVDLIVKCIEHPKAANQTFLVSDGDDLSTSELLQQIAKAIGRSIILLPIPVSVMTFVAKLLGKKSIADRLFGSLQVDIKHTCETLSWQPPLSVEESMQRSFRD